MIAVVGSRANESTVDLVSTWQALGLDAQLVAGERIAAVVEPGDVVVGRLDVLDSLDGVEPGLLELLLLEKQGFRVLNRAAALLGSHDKLRTAGILATACLPAPRTVHVRRDVMPPFGPPYVLKPRFGSWGRDVYLCPDRDTLRRQLAALEGRAWFRRHGVLVQEAIPNDGRDLRVIVAGGCVVGVGERRAAPGEWRTNVSCGGTLVPTELDPDVVELARAAAAVLDADFVGVDVMPTTDDGLSVLEVNGAVEFDEACAIGGRSVAERAATALGLIQASMPVG